MCPFSGPIQRSLPAFRKLCPDKGRSPRFRPPGPACARSCRAWNRACTRPSLRSADPSSVRHSPRSPGSPPSRCPSGAAGSEEEEGSAAPRRRSDRFSSRHSRKLSCPLPEGSRHHKGKSEASFPAARSPPPLSGKMPRSRRPGSRPGPGCHPEETAFPHQM